ncbi:hypothetical protein ACFLS1_05785 [Verrucomicrobiota bacterium]
MKYMKQFFILFVALLFSCNAVQARGNKTSSRSTTEAILSGEIDKKQKKQAEAIAKFMEEEIRREEKAQEQRQKLAAQRAIGPMSFLGLKIGGSKEEAKKIIAEGPYKMALRERKNKDGDIEYFTYRDNFKLQDAIFTGIEFWNNKLLRVTVGFQPDDPDTKYEDLLSSLKKKYGEFTTPKGYDPSSACQRTVGDCSIIIMKSGKDPEPTKITVMAWNVKELKKQRNPPPATD